MEYFGWIMSWLFRVGCFVEYFGWIMSWLFRIGGFVEYFGWIIRLLALSRCVRAAAGMHSACLSCQTSGASSASVQSAHNACIPPHQCNIHLLSIFSSNDLYRSLWAESLFFSPGIYAAPLDLSIKPVTNKIRRGLLAPAKIYV